RELLEERWGRGYQRCLAHLRRLLEHLPGELVNQRLVFMGMAMQAWLAAREAALDASGPGKHRFWDVGSTTDSMIDSLSGLLEAEPTPALAAQVPRGG
ncbi:MAG: TetR/AcrR family transcriptional regulator, partial [Phenylobacterium zucineum]